MKAKKASLLLFLLLLQTAAGFIPACNDIAANCGVEAPAGIAGEFCDTENRTTAHKICPDSTVPTVGVGLGFCMVWKTSVGVRNPGPCGCPSSCFAAFGNGRCDDIDGSCKCAGAWRGPDCSLPATDAACSGRGHVETVLGQPACVCDAGFGGVDCGTTLFSKAPHIDATVDVKHFSDSDPYRLMHHPLFNASSLGQVRMTLSSEDLEWFLDPARKGEDEYHLVQEFAFDNGVVRERLANVGFKHTGSLTNLFAKKGFHLSFSHFEKGRTWYRIKSLKLKAVTVDPTCVREIASAAVGYSLGMPVSRMSLVTLWVNGEFWGLYTAYEDVDELFIASRAELGDSNAAFWKTHWGATFEYLGDDPELYRAAECQGAHVYEAKSDAADKDFGPIARLAKALNETSKKELDAVMDVEFFLRTLVMEAATGNWDGLPNNGNNLYLYLDKTSGLLKIFRHDLDLSFGFPLSIGLPQRSFDTTNVYEYGKESPLTAVLQIPEYRAKYTEYWRALLAKYLRLDGNLIARATMLHDIARPALLRDQWHQQSLTLTSEDFETGFSTIVGNITGITQFLEKRIASAESQLDH